MSSATEPRIRRIDLGTTAIYLLQAERTLLMVDSGYATNEKRLFSALRRIGVNLGDVGLLLLTHHHDDHAGLCSRLTTLRPEIRVIAHEHAVALLAHGANDLSHGGFWLNWRVRLLGGLKGVVDPGWSAHRFPPYRVRECDLVIHGQRDDEVLRRLGIAGSIVALPGHTVDSIGIVLDSGDAFVGDAAANFLRFAGTRHCVVFVTDLDEYYASWRRLIDAGARRIHPAHGAPFTVEHLVRDLGANRKADLVRYPIGAGATHHD